jgi:glycine cleavage system H lipoate-binding protein
MFPWIYEFRWSAGHLIFLGVFFTVLAVIASSVVAAARRARRDVETGRAGRIAWRNGFDELPRSARSCRHALTGDLPGRVCPNAFSCGDCGIHPSFNRAPAAGRADDIVVAGIPFPRSLRYHRAHTWLSDEPDGTSGIGLDGLALRVLGAPLSLRLPEPGSRITADGPAFRIVREGRSYDAISPVSGEVVASGVEEGRPWVVKVRPDPVPSERERLLGGNEILPWIEHDLQRLLGCVSGGSTVTMTDGGELLPELGGRYPEEVMDRARSELLMNS